jgi:hypothetical protein
MKKQKRKQTQKHDKLDEFLALFLASKTGEIESTLTIGTRFCALESLLGEICIKLECSYEHFEKVHAQRKKYYHHKILRAMEDSGYTSEAAKLCGEEMEYVPDVSDLLRLFPER